MLSLEAVRDFLEKGKTRSDDLRRNDQVYYEMSLHIDGACPSYEDTRYGSWIYPTNWFGYEYDLIFQTKHFTKFQNESDATRNWRLSTYRPFQQEAFIKAIQLIIGAIFQDGNYSINIDNKEDYDYIWGENFEGKHLVGYLSKYFKNTCNDPNSYYLIIPKYSRFEQLGKVEPIVWHIPSTNILFVSKEEIIFERDDYVWLVNKIGYFRFKEQDKKWALLDQGGYYAHMLNRVPFYIAGGIWNTQGFYESWLNAAKPVADEYIGEKSLATLVNKQNAHALIQMVEEDCPGCQGAKLVQWCSKCKTEATSCNCEYDRAAYSMNPMWTQATCSSCGGTGHRNQDPAKFYYVPIENMAQPAARFISPDPEIPRVQFENVKEVEARIMRALHLNYIEEAQSGAAKEKDMETRYQFLSMVSNSIYDELLYNWIKDILAIRNVVSVQGETVPADTTFRIEKPMQFSILSAQELLDQLGGVVPDYVRNKQVEDLVDKTFGGDVVMKRKTFIINELDVVANVQDSVIIQRLNQGGITRREYQYHIFLPFILQTIERDNGSNFLLTKPIDTIKELADRKFSEFNLPSLEIDDEEPTN